MALLAVLFGKPAISQTQTVDPADLEVRKSVDVVTPTDPLQPVEFLVATAAYGTAIHERIDVLRHFRDHHLAHWPGGETLIGWYYQYSPPIADYIEPRPALRGIVRGLLTPLVFVLAYPWYALAGILFFILALWGLRQSRSTRTRHATD